MKISYKGDYAIKALLFLAIKYEEGRQKYSRLAEISKTQDIPIKFLEQIMLILKNAGYVKSHRGKNGGFYISKKPAEIKLGEIIRLIDGSVSPIACVSKSNYKYCDFEDKFSYPCVLKSIWKDVADATRKIVDNITFKDLAEKEKSLRMKKTGAYAYEI